MSKVQGLYIDTRRPLVVLRNTSMPVNLGRSGYEDNPEAPLPAVPYDGQNILPTALGYRSAFYPSPFWRNLDDPIDPTKGGLTDTIFQDIFTYQTITGFKLAIGLAEGGIWMYNHANEILDPVNPEIDHSLDYWTRITQVFEETGVKFLWTRCTLDNRVYMYHQGDDQLFLLVNYADYLQFKDLPQYGTVWFSEYYQMALMTAKPTFINMSGQVGLFKADNRLGFWDTDNAVSWSSAIDKVDFKPDATTFAGVTKFSNVAGNITMIKQHGRGFIIYSTASITHIQPAASLERWQATPVFAQLGVLYDTQVTTGADDLVHFFWASTGGIYRLANGKAEPYEPELTLFFKQEGKIVSLKMLCGTHLFVEISSMDVVDSGAQRYGRLVFDGKGTPLILNPPPKYGDPTYGKGFPTSWILDAQGSMPDEDPLADYELIEEDVQLPDPKLGEALIPCYTGWTFVLPGGMSNPDELHWDEASIESLDVSSWPRASGWSFPLDGNPTEYYISSASRYNEVKPDPTFFSYEAGPIVSPPGARFIDKAGDEFWEIMQKAYDDMYKLSMRFFEIMKLRVKSDDIPEPIGTNRYGLVVGLECDPFPNYYEGWPYPVPEKPADEDLQVSLPITPTILRNVISSVEMKEEDDGCVKKLIAYIADYNIGTDMKFWIQNEMTMPHPDQEDYPGNYVYFNSNENIYYYEFNFDGIFEEIPGTRREVVVFQCEVSGYGYVPSGGFSFRRTHQRSIFKTCAPVENPSITIFDPKEAEEEIENSDGPSIWLIQGPYDPSWNYYYNPGYSNMDPNNYAPYVPSVPGYPNMSPLFATFGKGIFSPYYPIYVRSYVKDLTQDKWGIYSDAHTILFDLIPANRTENITYEGNIMSQDTLNMGAVFSVNAAEPIPGTETYGNAPVLLLPFNNYSKITYGKIGMSRAEVTWVVGGSFSLGSQSDNIHEAAVNITISASFDNITQGKTLSYNPIPEDMNAVTFFIQGTRQTEIPFNLQGRWFNVTLQGQFDINYMALYGKRSGRLRFAQLPPQ